MFACARTGTGKHIKNETLLIINSLYVYLCLPTFVSIFDLYSKKVNAGKHAKPFVHLCLRPF